LHLKMEKGNKEENKLERERERIEYKVERERIEYKVERETLDKKRIKIKNLIINTFNIFTNSMCPF
jgi:hypothetical protein